MQKTLFENVLEESCSKIKDKKMKKIMIIGHFGFGKNLLNGQTIKTQNITSALEKKYGKSKIKKVDTNGNFFKLFFSLLKIIYYFFLSSDIIFLPAKNGLRKLVPIIVFLNSIFHRRLHYITIGGWLSEYLTKNKKNTKFVKKINFIYVETIYIKEQLSFLNLKNLFVMPNCKHIEILDKSKISINSGNNLKICTFSRVSKYKGIGEAVDAINNLLYTDNNLKIKLDIYGQVSKAEKTWFDLLSQTFPKNIKYCGEIDPDKSVSIISNYDILLFPSFYEGEGFPGTIIDAFCSGVPVIAYDWKSNSEIISNDTGFIVPTHDVSAISNLLVSIYSNKSLLLNMKYNCLNEAHKYEIDCVIEILCNNIKGI